ncbi:hypothetical protein B0H15DRAFT_135443 [Mycena belliarum]|uniref:Uncharacterized protein n=1 Tax=Mycena belliarum TaxID=1033014 RepID=A0AAD6UB43_9AGAR|nr:hypothetical protein B0H15DRAFT_135443 [Mycena belliae]
MSARKARSGGGANIALFGRRQRRRLERVCPTAGTRGAGVDLRGCAGGTCARDAARDVRARAFSANPTRPAATRFARPSSRRAGHNSRDGARDLRARAARLAFSDDPARPAAAAGLDSRVAGLARIVLGGGNARPWADSGSQRAFGAFGARAEVGRERGGGVVGVWVKRRRRGGSDSAVCGGETGARPRV